MFASGVSECAARLTFAGNGRIVDDFRVAAQAVDFLSRGRLEFGNVQQIQAVRMIELAEGLIGTKWVCDDCEGTGETEGSSGGSCNNCGESCPYCDGDSDEECEKCEGTGVMKLNKDMVYHMTLIGLSKLKKPGAANVKSKARS